MYTEIQQNLETTRDNAKAKFEQYKQQESFMRITNLANILYSELNDAKEKATAKNVDIQAQLLSAYNQTANYISDLKYQDSQYVQPLETFYNEIKDQVNDTNSTYSQKSDLLNKIKLENNKAKIQQDIVNISNQYNGFADALINGSANTNSEYAKSLTQEQRNKVQVAKNEYEQIIQEVKTNWQASYDAHNNAELEQHLAKLASLQPTSDNKINDDQLQGYEILNNFYNEKAFSAQEGLYYKQAYEYLKYYDLFKPGDVVRTWTGGEFITSAIELVKKAYNDYKYNFRYQEDAIGGQKHNLYHGSNTDELMAKLPKAMFDIIQLDTFWSFGNKERNDSLAWYEVFEKIKANEKLKALYEQIKALTPSTIDSSQDYVFDDESNQINSGTENNTALMAALDPLNQYWKYLVKTETTVNNLQRIIDNVEAIYNAAMPTVAGSSTADNAKLVRSWTKYKWNKDNNYMYYEFTNYWSQAVVKWANQKAQQYQTYGEAIVDKEGSAYKEFQVKLAEFKKLFNADQWDNVTNKVTYTIPPYAAKDAEKFLDDLTKGQAILDRLDQLKTPTLN
ncbi:hypothetical protein ACWXVL_01855 [Mycoplasma sp. 128]